MDFTNEEQKVIAMLEYLASRGYTIEDVVSLVRIMSRINPFISEEAKSSIKQKRTDFYIEEKIVGILTEIGFPSHGSGYQYLKTAIDFVIHNPNSINSITNVLYPAVASKHNTTVRGVEKGIRSSIESVWTDRGDIEVFQKYFGNTVSMHKGRPTNGEFIAKVVEIVQLEVKRAEIQ